MRRRFEIIAKAVTLVLAIFFLIALSVIFLDSVFGGVNTSSSSPERELSLRPTIKVIEAASPSYTLPTPYPTTHVIYTAPTSYQGSPNDDYKEQINKQNECSKKLADYYDCLNDYQTELAKYNSCKARVQTEQLEYETCQRRNDDAWDRYEDCLRYETRSPKTIYCSHQTESCSIPFTLDCVREPDNYCIKPNCS